MYNTDKNDSMGKENSTNAINKKTLLATCGMAYALEIIGGRWKPTILWRLTLQGTLRYNKLKTAIPNITDRMLISQLRELEKHRLIERIVYPVVPPKVEYKLTAAGKTLKPVLEAITLWGEGQMNENK